MTFEDPIFIVGIGRSGTTLLRKMINSHPNIAIPYETHFITNYDSKLPGYGDLENEANLKKLVDDILNEKMIKLWDHEFDNNKVIAAIQEKTLSGVIDAIYQIYAKAHGKKRWGDKSDYLDRMHVINKIFPTCKFIHIIRDGRDVATSVIKLRWGPTDIIEAAHWWREYIRLGCRMGAILGDSRYIEVRFEDLVTRPTPELIKICDFIDEEFTPQMLDYHKQSNQDIPDSRVHQHYNTDKLPQAKRAFAWKEGLSFRKRLIFDSIAGEELQNNGYEIYSGPNKPFLIKMTVLSIYFKRLFTKILIGKYKVR